MDVRALRVDDDAELSAYHRVRVAAESFERPWYSRFSAEDLRLQFTDDDPGERTLPVVALEGGEVVGAGVAWLFDSDNQHIGHVMPWVAPEQRRRGVGTALLEHLLGILVDDGRSQVVMETGYPVDRQADHPYRRFAEHHGFALANTEIRRLLDLPVDPDLLDRLGAHAAERHGDYTIVSFDARETPPELLPSLVLTKARLALDAPTGDVTYEAENLTVEMYHHRKDMLARQGQRMLSTVAVSPAGEAVAYNDLVLMPGANPYVAQWGTLVHPDHRGHRLGTAVKVAGLRWLGQEAGPHVRFVNTCNAEQNAAMVGINEALGFRKVEVTPAFLRNLA